MQGESNFNFTVNFNCKPFIPYFPAGYHDNSRGNCFVIGLETPDLLVKSLESLPDRQQDHNDRFKAAHDALAAVSSKECSSMTRMSAGDNSIPRKDVLDFLVTRSIGALVPAPLPR